MTAALTPVERLADRLSTHIACWWALVSLESLDLSSYDDGLLEQIDAQLHPALPPVALLLGAPTDVVARLDWERAHGLRPLRDQDPDAWAALTDAWRELVTAKRARTAGRWADEALGLRAARTAERAVPRDRQNVAQPQACVCTYGADGEVVRGEPLPVEVARTMAATNSGLGRMQWAEPCDLERAVDLSRGAA